MAEETKEVLPAVAVADAELLKKLLAERLTPGEHPEDKQLNELVGIGKCEGVFFLDKGITYTEIQDGSIHASHTASYERQALRYLKPMSPHWHAKRALINNNVSKATGTSRPEVDFLITAEMRAESEKTERRIRWIFNCEDCCIHAVQPQHRGRWKVFPVEEGVWAVLYL